MAGAFGRGGIDISEIGHIFGGRSAKPERPMLVYGPDSRVLTMVVGGGEAEAAELEELALAASEKMVERKKDDYMAQLREEAGRPPREKVTELVSEALRDHGRDQIANPSNYPKRTPPRRSWVKNLPEIPVP